MEFFETRIANAITDDIMWVRYVDDVFAVMKRDRDIDRTLSELNNLVPSISFTVEKEVGGIISFLDASVIRLPSSDSYKFKIYRKPTNNNLIISNYSYHTISVKLSALRSMFLRALNICSPEFIDEEFEFIYHVGSQNHFSIQEIDHSLKLAKRTFYSGKKVHMENSNFISLPYHPTLETIVQPLKLLGFCATFSYPMTIGKTLIRNSPVDDEGVVYKIPCKCRKYYTGQRGKSLDTRILNHKYNVRTDNPRSAICLHSRTCTFPIDWCQSKILFKNVNFIERNIIETACICHTKQDNFNSNLGLYKLDPFVLHTIQQQYKMHNV